jgi:hypothetical protein
MKASFGLLGKKCKEEGARNNSLLASIQKSRNEASDGGKEFESENI